MKKNIFAVCDLEADYASSFMNYLNQKKNIPFDIQAFSSVEKLMNYGKEMRIELLLISARAMRQEVRELDIGQIIILSEGSALPELKGYPSVYKYQATSDVVREVMACYGEEGKLSPSTFSFMKKTTKIYAIYSPVNRCMKTSLALTMGQILAKKQSTLYLSLEGYSGFPELLGKEYAHTLSDLFYYIRQGDGNFMFRMNGMIQTVNGLDYIPPVQTPADVLGVVWEDLDKLLSEIILHSSYEQVILDVGNEIQDLFPLLERCDRIYMPVRKDPVSDCKIRQFEKLARDWDYAQVLSKMERLVLPEFSAGEIVKNYVEELPFGEMGAYAKQLLE